MVLSLLWNLHVLHTNDREENCWRRLLAPSAVLVLMMMSQNLKGFDFLDGSGGSGGIVVIVVAVVAVVGILYLESRV